MPHNKVSRNDPCPCGSGKKYKKCCMKTDELEAQKERSLGDNYISKREEVLDKIIFTVEFRELMKRQEAENGNVRYSDAAGEVNKYLYKANPHFLGLIPWTIDLILDRPVSENEELLSLIPGKVHKEELVQAPLMTLVLACMNYLNDHGTARWKEDLLKSDQVVECLALEYSGEPGTWSSPQLLKLYLIEALPLLAGLMKKNNGLYRLSSEGKTLLEQEDFFEIYKRLFYAYSEKYNWFDIHKNFPEAVRYIQDALIYLLYMLKKKAEDRFPVVELGEVFMKNFHPITRALHDYTESKDRTLAGFVKMLWAEKFLYGFCVHLGLVETGESLVDDREKGDTITVPWIQTSPLFKKIFKWGI